jgi:hypothetical protein
MRAGPVRFRGWRVGVECDAGGRLAGGAVVKQPTTRRLGPWKGTALLVLVVLAVHGAPAAAQDLLRWTRNEPGEARPINLYADDITTWVDQGRRVFLLKGHVWIEQGVVGIHQAQGVVWIDEGLKQRTGVYHLDLYGDGKVTVEDGSKSLSGVQALLELNTRGEIRVRGKVSNVAAHGDPLYVRASALRFGSQGSTLPSAALPTPPLEQRSAEKPGNYAPPADQLQRTAAETIIPVQPASPPGPPVPGDAGPNPGASPAPVPAVPMQQQWVPGQGAIPAQPMQQPMQQGTPGVEPTNPVVPTFPVPPSPGTIPPTPPLVPPPPTPFVPPPAVVPPTPPRAALPPPGNGPPRQLTIRPRYSREIQAENFPSPNGENTVVINSGVILTISNIDNKQGILDIEADRLVFWTRGDNTQELLGNMRSPQGQQSQSLEFYLAGNVEIRTKEGKEERLLRAAEVYYDVSRSVAIALQAELEIKQPLVADPLHVKAQELQQLNPKLSHVIRSEVFSSKLPSDPGIKLVVAEGDLEEKEIPKKSIFGRQVISSVTGLPEMQTQQIFTGRNAFLDVAVTSDIYAPIFYWPYIRVDVRDPLGPLENVGFNYNRIFGFQFLTTFDMYDLIGVDREPGTRWKAHVDYLTERGPALGMNYDFTRKELFGIPGQYSGTINAYGIDDTGLDILGGNRGQQIFVSATDIREIHHPEWRGRFSGLFQGQDLPEGFTVQARTYVLSDRNFMEQYFLNEYNNGPEQETSVYVKQQQGIWAWTALAAPRILDWYTTTSYLPQVNGYLIGQKFFDLFTYNVRGDATYAHLQPADLPPPDNKPPPFQITNANVETARFDLYQELSLPFTLGPFKVVPYAKLDLAYYTEDLDGDDRGRLYEGVGLMASIPFSRLYRDVQSELLNVDGIYHKIVITGNYYTAHSDTSFTQLPQIDQLHDLNSSKALRDFYPEAPYINPNGLLLATSPIFNPQLYAIRTLVDNRIDTLDSVDVFQFDVRQRLQTKRGYPGMEHIIDWMTLDVSTSIFPESNRDDFGSTVGFITYDYAWNVGDRVALFSSGLFEPFQNGGETYNVGVSINKPDRTTFVFSYRQIDPVGSKAILSAVTYAFSPKYAVTASTLYDFGTKNYILSSTITRTGTDLRLIVGLGYTSLLNTFSFNLEIVPNVVPASRVGVPGTGGFGSSLLSQR